MNSTTKLHRTLNRLQQEHRKLLKYLTGKHELAIGSVSKMRRRCGNPRCHCRQGKGHLQVIFLFNDSRRCRRCKLIRRADENRMLQAANRYRQTRSHLRKLRAIQNRQRQILLALINKRGIRYT